MSGYKHLNSATGSMSSWIFAYNRRNNLPRPITEPIKNIPPYPANINNTEKTFFYNAKDEPSNRWENFGGNLQNTRFIEPNSTLSVKSENCLNFGCNQQVKLPMTLNGKQLSGISLTYHGVCDNTHYYNVIITDKATYLGNNSVGILYEFSSSVSSLIFSCFF